jgi:parallel beta-helix repeat protein
VNNFASLFVLLLLSSIVLVSFPQLVDANSEPNTLVVPDDYASIQEAIDTAEDGDTVCVKSGEYHENLVVNKSLSLIGENMNTTIVDGNPPEGYRIPIKIQCDNVSVSGFKFLYGDSGITVGDSKYCNIFGNRIADNRHGVVLVSCSYCNVTENYFEQIGLSSAIQLSYSNYNLVAGNYIDSCTEGIQIWLGSCNNTLTGNTITNCSNYALSFQYSDKNIVTRNDISNSDFGTAIYVSNLNNISYNNYVNNNVNFASDSNESYAMTFGHNVSVNIINKNYWSDYNGTDNNGDSIGDEPYVINEKNQDNYPLLTPVTIEAIPEFPSWIPLFFTLTAVIVAAMVYRQRLGKSQWRADK